MTLHSYLFKILFLCSMNFTQSPRTLTYANVRTTKGERKCHDFLPSFSPRRPFGVQNGLADFLLSFFGCRPKWRTKKAPQLFCCPFGDFLASKTKKRTAKSHRAFFLSSNLVSNQKKTAKSRRGHFGRQKVVMVKRTAKSRGTCVHLYYPLEIINNFFLDRASRDGLWYIPCLEMLFWVLRDSEC